MQRMDDTPLFYRDRGPSAGPCGSYEVCRTHETHEMRSLEMGGIESASIDHRLQPGYHQVRCSRLALGNGQHGLIREETADRLRVEQEPQPWVEVPQPAELLRAERGEPT